MTLLILSSFLKPASAQDIQFLDQKKFNLLAELAYNASDIQTKKTESTNAGNIKVTALNLELGGDYFVFPKLALTGSVAITLYTSTDAEMKGVEGGFRYYPWAPGNKSSTTLQGSQLQTSPGVSYFVHLGYAGKDYQFANSSLFFQGSEIGGGFDYHRDQKTFFRLNLDYQNLQNTTSRTQKGLAIGFAYGISL